MLQTKIITRILWIWLITILCSFGWYKHQHGSDKTKKFQQDRKQELVGSLIYIPNTEKFELRLENRAKSTLAVVRHPALYEVRVFDCSGNKVTDMDAYMEQVRVRNVMDDDWVTLISGEVVSFQIRAYRLPERNGKIEVNGLRADCVRYERMSYNSIPDFVKKTNAKIAVFEGTPSILL